MRSGEIGNLPKILPRFSDIEIRSDLSLTSSLPIFEIREYRILYDINESHFHQKFHTPDDLIRTSVKSRPDLGARTDLGLGSTSAICGPVL